MPTIKPPTGAPAPIHVGFGGRDFEPSQDGSWTVDADVADDLIRKGWVVVTDATMADVPADQSAPAEPEA